MSAAGEHVDTIDPRRFYRAADIARLVFARSLSWFYINRARLESTDGFPTPISSIGRPRWNGKDLRDWIDRPKCCHHGVVITGDTGVIDFSGALRERARKIAAR
jgi:hypothetical protein